MLREQGYEAELVADADDALARCAENRYDLLVTDLVMPGRDGWEIAEAIRSQQPGISVLFTSGYTSATVNERGLPPRAAFLPKPFTMSELVAAVNALLPRTAAACLHRS
jgi:DNA-binding response OmpR family regulator